MDKRKTELYADIVKTEVRNAKNLTLEHREQLLGRIEDALSCMNGEPDKIGLIAKFAATSEISRIHGDLREDSKIDSAMHRAVDLSEERFTRTMTDILEKHKETCPASLMIDDTKGKKSSNPFVRFASEDKLTIGKLTITGSSARLAVVVLGILLAFFFISLRQETIFRQELKTALPKIINDVLCPTGAVTDGESHPVAKLDADDLSNKNTKQKEDT